MDKFTLLKNTADQLFVTGNDDITSIVFSENYVVHSGDKTYPGQAFVRQFALPYTYYQIQNS